MAEDNDNMNFNENDEDIDLDDIMAELDDSLDYTDHMDHMKLPNSGEYSKEDMEKFKMKERERVFSGDLYQKMYTIIFYLNFIEAHDATIHDNDAWKPCIKFFTLMEAREFYDSICPPIRRKQIREEEHFRPDELASLGDIRSVFGWLYNVLEFRYRFLHKLKEFLIHRNREFAKAVRENKGCKPLLLRKMDELTQTFDLTDIEKKIILFIYIAHSDNYFCLGDFVDGFNGRDMKIEYILDALKMKEEQVLPVLAANGRLSRFGFVDTDDFTLERFFINYLNGAQMTPVTDRFYKLFEGESLSWDMYGKFSEEEGSRLVQLIDSKGADRGLNILFHGAPGTGKTSFVQSLAKKMGKQLYMIRLHSPDRESNTKSFRFAALEVANYRLNPEKVIVCVDECDDMLESGYCSNSFMFSFFGGGHRGNPREKSLLNETLDRLKLTTIWVANTDRNSIDPSCRRRFDYNIVFEKVSPKTRKFIWGNVLKRYGMEEALSDEFLTSVSERYPVNTGGIDVAVRNAAYIYKKSPKQDFQDLVMTYLQAHCNILNIRENRSLNEVARDYSLKGLNIKMGPSLDRIIEACKNFCKKIKKAELAPDSPRMNILLAGAPGTGKTEFVKYLAKKLDKKLTIKMANDLLDCFVGETEKRIANAFEEAFQEKSILFIDEGDAMLGSRSKATHSWEVTMVTTLLNQMENFQGIFVMATNFAQHLDTAALRRFTYKLQFDYLDEEGKELFYKRSFAHLKLPPMNELERAALARIEKLTPGDFRTVRQQFYYLGDSKVSHREILDVLQAESNTKPQEPTQDAFNQTKRSIGFSSRESA